MMLLKEIMVTALQRSWAERKALRGFDSSESKLNTSAGATRVNTTTGVVVNLRKDAPGSLGHIRCVASVGATLPSAHAAWGGHAGVIGKTLA